MSLAHNAYVSGSLRQAHFLLDGVATVLDADKKAKPRPAQRNDSFIFFQHALEIRPASDDGSPIDIKTLHEELRKDSAFCDALNGLLAGMDPDYSQDLRARYIRRTNFLLTQNKGFHDAFALRIFRPFNGQVWCPQSALEIAKKQKNTLVTMLYAPLAKGTLNQVYDWVEDTLVEKGIKGKTLATLIDAYQETGLIKDAVFALEEGEIHKLYTKILSNTLENHTLKEQDPNLKIWTAVADVVAGNVIKAKLDNKKERDSDPATKSDYDDGKHVVHKESAYPGLSRALESFQQNQQNRKGRDHTINFDIGAEIEAVSRQMNFFKEQMGAQRLSKALNTLEKLLLRQAKSAKAQDIQKTLTNAASITIEYKEFDLALWLVERAQSLVAPDATVLNVKAEVLRALGRHNEALSLLKETMERFPNDEVARYVCAEMLPPRDAMTKP